MRYSKNSYSRIRCCRYFGLSALASIGYFKKEVVDIRKLNLSITKLGLLKSKKDAKMFREYANKHIKELAPFMVLEILIKLKIKDL